MSFLIFLVLSCAPALGPAHGICAETNPADAAFQKGVDFLLATQNKDGSWGKHCSSRRIEVLAAVPGSHRAFRAATTGLCVMALDSAAQADATPEVIEAVERGKEYLIEHACVKRANSAEMYNVWAFGYGLQALATLIPAEKDAALKKGMEETANEIIRSLRVYQVPDGGWGYFDFDYGAYRPAGSSMTFTTATILVGLYEAKNAGLDVPQKMLDSALNSLRRARKEDGSYIYGDYLKYRPNMSVNQVKGSISRTPACHMAQRIFGAGQVTDNDLIQSLDDLLEHQHFADIARKRPIPHESWYATSGYFFYFGEYYAALAVKELPQKERARFAEAFTKILLDLQEQDGSWWDYTLYSYHKQYGTAYALLCLSLYREIAR